MRNVFVGLILLTVAASHRSLGAEAPGEFESLLGARADVELKSGEVLQGVEIVKLGPGKIAGTLSSVTVREPSEGRRTMYGAAGIRRIKSADGKWQVAYDPAIKALVQPGAKNLAEIREAARKKQQVDENRQAAADEVRRKKEEEDERRRIEEEKSQAAERAAAERASAQQRAAVQEQKEYLGKVAAAFRANNMRLYETKYFLFLSDMPPNQVALYTPYLDKMYRELCKAFGIKQGTDVWRGKAVVVAFLAKESFWAFEKAFFNHQEAVGAQGLAHSNSNGNVVISCFRGDDPEYFATVLVHETAHGFMHRYAGFGVPSWLDEGAAEWIAAAVVTTEKEVQNRQQRAIQQMRTTGTMGGDFFTSPRIGGWQYGAASHLANFLLRSDPQRYRALLDGIKKGLPWQESLKKAYGATPEQLARQYGLSIGVPNLVP
ncbi:MAG: hypothetical protein ACYC0Y_00650 [Pirellulales bacterium]